jgi:uncharacterized protein YraI
MNEEPRRQLGELIANPKYGRSLCDNIQQCEGLLRDLCGKHPTEISALVAAAKEKIPGELLSSHNGTSSEALLARLTKRLQDNLALDEKAARWAVESWALALGVISSEALRDIHIQPQTANKPQITKAKEEQRQRKAAERQRKAVERQLAEEKQRRQEAESKLELERQTKEKKDWLKAIIIGSVIGTFGLGSLALSKYLPKQSVTPVPNPTPTPSIATQPLNPSPVSPVIPSPTSEPPAPPPSMQTNATIVGEPGYKNIRSGPGTDYSKKHIAYPGDRVRVIESTRNSDNFPWYKIYFPKSGAEGWIAGNLLAIDGQAPYQSQPQPQPQTQSKTSSTQTNATVSGTPGTKNLRSGAGTVYEVVGTAHTGDRVQILGSSYDRGNYQWYQVYHPQSGTRGWIAAQLIKLD